MTPRVSSAAMMVPSGFMHAHFMCFDVIFGLSVCCSFSGASAVSGQDSYSTAFFGCDDGICCVCYGQVGDSQDFCYNGCIAQNGGVVNKTGEAYFYIR